MIKVFYMTSSDCGLWLLYNLMVLHVLLIIVYCTPLTSMVGTVKLRKSKQHKIQKSSPSPAFASFCCSLVM